MTRARAFCGLLLAATLLCVALPEAARAHSRSMSYSTWKIEDQHASVELRLKLIELTRQPPGHSWTSDFPKQLRLHSDGVPCTAENARRIRPEPEGWAVFRWTIRCDEPGARTIESDLMRDLVAGHTHFARVDLIRPLDSPDSAASPDSPGNGAASQMQERLLVSDRSPVWALDANATDQGAQTSLPSFIALGVEHIATGWDHLAFVIALLLLAGSLREVAGLVTSFSVAHSITLGLAVLGWVRPSPAAVEVLIGFSIALVAAENGWLLAARDRWIPALSVAALCVAAGVSATLTGALTGALSGAQGAAAHGLSAVAWLGLAIFAGCHFGLLRRAERPARLRTAVAFVFGLIHGFGFAGVLTELELETSSLLAALFGFNVGVELGQLVIVAMVWPGLAWLAHRAPPAHRWVAELGSATVLGLGLFWVVERGF